MKKLYHYTRLGIIDKIARKDFLYLRSTYYQRFGRDDYEVFRSISPNLIEGICKEYKWNYDPDMLMIKPFITSFCTNPNSEYMWENYGDKGQGIKLILNKDILSNIEHNYGFDEKGTKYKIDNNLECASLCTYIDDIKEIKTNLLHNLENSFLDKEKWSHYERMVLLLATFKKKSFEEEEEYRHICLYPIVFTMEYSQEKGEPIIDDDPMPTFEHLDLLYPKKILVGIELGYKTSKENMQNAISCLDNNGYRIERIESKTILLNLNNE